MYIAIDQPKAIEFILSQMYLKEFESIDGCNRHRDGMNYAEWLHHKKLITDEELNKVLDEWSKETEF